MFFFYVSDYIFLHYEEGAHFDSLKTQQDWCISRRTKGCLWNFRHHRSTSHDFETLQNDYPTKSSAIE
ncbi:hypothetical protein Hdeb2414_s0011g00362611 [Helianthus debilis subsp. tardiflorus]